jgi:hypothetical protein
MAGNLHDGYSFINLAHMEFVTEKAKNPSDRVA